MSATAPDTTAADRLVARWMLAALARPRLVFTCVATLLVLSLISLTRLGIDADSSRMLDPDLPDQRRAHALADAFPDLKGNLIVLIRADRADEADAAADALADRLLAREDVIAGVFAAALDPFFAAHGFMYDNREAVADRLTRLSQAANMLARLRADPTLAGFLGALAEAQTLVARAEVPTDTLARLEQETAAVFAAEAAGTPRDFAWSNLLEPGSGPVTRLVSVTPRLDQTRLSPARPALDAVAEARGALSLPPGVTVAMTGEPALRAEEMRSVTSTIGLSLALSLLLVIALLRLGLGSWRQSGAAMLALLVALVLTGGVAALAVGALNLISVAFVVLMVGLGIDFAIHVLAHLSEGEASPETAVAATGHGIGLALVLSALTTFGAFLAFTTTDFAGMAQLGLIGAAGVLIAFATSVTLLPALAATAPALIRHSQGVRIRQVPTLRFAPVLALALGTAALPLALEARFDADPMGLRNADAPSVQAFRLLAETPETSPYRISVLAEDAAEAARIRARLVDVPGVGRITTLADLIPVDQLAKLDILDLAALSLEHAVSGMPTALTDTQTTVPRAIAALTANRPPGDPLAGALLAYDARRGDASDAEMAARLFRHFPRMMARIGAMLEAGEVTAASLPAPLRRRYVNEQGVQRVDVAPASALAKPADLEAFAATVRDAVPEAAGGPVQLSAAARTVGNAMLHATIGAAALTLLLAWIATGHLVVTLAITAPLALAGILTAAVSVLLGLPFNYANVIVLPLMIGMGVDAGIHIALRTRRTARLDQSSTPRAVVLSALTTLAAFGTLGLSDHRGTASMGILLAVSLLATLLSVFALTPALIRWTQPREVR